MPIPRVPSRKARSWSAIQVIDSGRLASPAFGGSAASAGTGKKWRKRRFRWLISCPGIIGIEGLAAGPDLSGASGLRHKEESLGADTRGSLLLLSERSKV
jgi:hypothetical protein